MTGNTGRYDRAAQREGRAMRAEIGVIGGSGFYSLFEQAESVRIDTP